MDIEQFFTLFINSRLLERAEAETLAAVFQEECQETSAPTTVDTFCDFLIASDRLTAWQCEKLRMGKWKGFFLDDYLILEHIGKDDYSIYYKARNTRNGSLVRLAVTPSSHSPFFEYCVESFAESS